MASLAGTCPIPASSGNTVRHRLNRGGDRRLNRALTTVVIVRIRVDPATSAYVARRRAEGRTTKEIMRSLKRDITRQLFRTLAAGRRSPDANRSLRSATSDAVVPPAWQAKQLQ
jgi:transposase